MFRIGAFSRLSGLSIDTLYHYQQQGILLPAMVDPDSGYRYYEAGQLAQVYRILALKDAGFCLEEIGRVLGQRLDDPALILLLERKAVELAEHLTQAQGRLSRLQSSLFLMKNGGIPLMNTISIKRVEPILVASLRLRHPKDRFDEVLEDLWARVNREIDRAKMNRSIPCLMLYHSGYANRKDCALPYEEGFLDVEVAEPVLMAFEAQDGVQVHALPAVERMACLVHKGPFSTIGPSYQALYDWMAQNGYQAAGPVREIYHKGDWATQDPNEYVTEIQAPLK